MTLLQFSRTLYYDYVHREIGHTQMWPCFFNGSHYTIFVEGHPVTISEFFFNFDQWFKRRF